MARPKKTGLDYFPFDVDFFNDEKIIAIAGEFGLKGEIATIKLLCAVYRNGYFIEWNEMFRLKMVRLLPGVSVDLLEQIVKRLVRWEFFDKNLFYSANILTSKGIQKRYFEAVKRRCNNDNLPFLLHNAHNNPINVCNNPINVCRNATKESKVNNKEISTDVDTKKMTSSTSEIKSLESEINGLKDDAIWLDQLQVIYHVDINQLRLLLDRFRQHCIANGIVHQNLRDSKQHFNNWMRKRKNDKDFIISGSRAISIPTREDMLKEQQQKASDEHNRVLGIYQMALKQPDSRYAAIVREWSKNGILEKHGLKISEDND